MHRTFRRLPSVGLALLLASLAGPLAAQSHRAAVTVTGGRSIHDDLTPGLDAPTILESGWVTGLQAETWLGSGRIGMRLNGLYARRPLEGAVDEYTVMSGDLDLLLRLLPAEGGRWFSPYLAAGGGLTRYTAADSVTPIADGAYGEDPIRVHGLAGIGADIGFGHRAGLRLEVADQIVFPSIGESPPTSGLPSTHNLVMTAGLQLRLGSIWGRGLRRRPGDVAAGRRPERAADPARPAAQPAAEPATQPATGAASRTRPTRPAEAARFTVQFGTFMEGAEADAWAARLRARGIPVWLVSTSLDGARISRVRVGAFPSEAEARAMVSVLTRDYDWTVRIDEIDAKDSPPAGAVRATREFLTRR